jgi:preprotein translocase subunit YajC
MFDLIPAALAQAAAAPATPQPPGILEMLMPFIVLIAVFYLMLWRPQMKRQKETQAMLAQLAKGDEVVTAGGLTGRIRDLGQNYVLLEVAKGVEVKVQRSAITLTLPKESLKGL